MISGLIHRASGTDGLADFRSSVKILANIVRARRLGGVGGSFPMRRVTQEICDGDPALSDVMAWYPKALKVANRSL